MFIEEVLRIIYKVEDSKQHVTELYYHATYKQFSASKLLFNVSHVKYFCIFSGSSLLSNCIINKMIFIFYLEKNSHIFGALKSIYQVRRWAEKSKS